MARIIRFAKALKNNPKKSIFFGGAAAFGFRFAKGKYEDHQLMRCYCEEALKIGDQIQRFNDKERHITVLLNPAANDGKARVLFERYCAPLFHLAGLKVAIVKTEHEGQARDYMKIMENTSAVVVAGGDGTLAEAVTGLMRRDDQSPTSKKLPLGLLPLGIKNNTASTIFGFSNIPEVRHLAEATMCVIKNIKRPLDVIEILPLNTTSDEPAKPVYAVSEVEWSAFRDAEDRKDKYWYWPFVKQYMSYVFSSYKDITWNCDADVEYLLPCAGCSNCSKPYQVPEVEQPIVPQRKWWQAFLPKFSVQPIKIEDDDDDDDKPDEDRSLIINPDCGKVFSSSLKEVCDVRVSSRNLDSAKDLPGHTLSIKSGVSNMSSFEFIKEGWKRTWTKDKQHSDELLVGEITIKPHLEIMKDSKDNDRELNIDNETFEVRPMKIRAVPRALKIFGPPEIKQIA